MGNAAGKRSDGLHFLGLAQTYLQLLLLLLGSPDFGAVCYHNAAHGNTVDIQRSGRSQMRPELGSALFQHSQIACLRFSGLKKLFAVQVVDFLVIGKDITGQRLLEQCTSIQVQQAGWLQGVPPCSMSGSALLRGLFMSSILSDYSPPMHSGDSGAISGASIALFGGGSAAFALTFFLDAMM